MSLWSYFSNTTPTSEQQAQLDAGKAKYNTALANRQAADTAAASNGGIADPLSGGYWMPDGSFVPYISDAQVAADQTYVAQLQIEDNGFVNSFTTRNVNTDNQKKPGVTDVFADFLALALIAGAGWLFISFGGAMAVRTSIAKKNWVLASALIGGAALWVYFLYTYGKKLSSDLKSVGGQTASAIGIPTGIFSGGGN